MHSPTCLCSFFAPQLLPPQYSKNLTGAVCQRCAVSSRVPELFLHCFVFLTVPGENVDDFVILWTNLISYSICVLGIDLSSINTLCVLVSYSLQPDFIKNSDLDPASLHMPLSWVYFKGWYTELWRLNGLKEFKMEKSWNFCVSKGQRLYVFLTRLSPDRSNNRKKMF